jgi:F subunit of K+-transporting ATPase
VRPALTATSWEPNAMMLYLTAVLTVAALFYLGYAMIRPEAF